MKKANFSQKKGKNFRIEKDSIGEIKVPAEAYFGSFTARALKNFNWSEVSLERSEGLKEFKSQLGLIKIASAQTNEALDRLNKKLSRTIQKAAREFIAGKFDQKSGKNFQINIFQAGAGTPFNMNANEIIANRANELLGGKKGIYEFVHPNNHVNMSQSSNDVIPTTIRLTVLVMQKKLKKQGKNLITTLQKKSRNFSNILKTGRTHLQDAVPITLGQEFASFAAALEKDFKNLMHAEENLAEIGLGGTAVGTGINTHPDYQKTVVKILSKLTGQKLIPTKNLFETTSNMNAFLAVSSAHRQIATTLQRIAEDLKILNMSTISEITLPEIEPGSSIMPGKINPSICECLQMICYQVMGNDHAVALACQKSQLELNVMTPLILKNLTDSIKLLTHGINTFEKFCISGIKANRDRCRELLEKGSCVTTALSPHIGYAKTAELIKEALKRKIPIEKLCKKKTLMNIEKLRSILNPENLTKP